MTEEILQVELRKIGNQFRVCLGCEDDRTKAIYSVGSTREMALTRAIERTKLLLESLTNIGEKHLKIQQL